MPAVARWTLLDALRGVAALIVVFWHWPHFWSGELVPGLSRGALPLYPVFAPLYDYGWIAVDMFFVLSGFVFFWKYQAAIAGRRIGPGQFALLRFARLYPLHLLTLALVATLQAAYSARFGYALVFANNDVYHFLLNLFMAEAWGLERGFSFDGPAWSVSIEVLLYAVFFLAASARLTGMWQIAIICVAAAIAYPAQEAILVRGIMDFFAGGLAFRIVDASASVRPAARYVGGLGVLLAGLCVMVVRRADEPDFIRATALLAFPALVYLLAVSEARVSAGRLQWLGDLSYASYLLHFPLQLLASYAVLTVAGPDGVAIFASAWTMLAFFAILVAVSLASNRWFERPAQRFILRLRRPAGANPDEDPGEVKFTPPAPASP
jgi:peptidoglycan/LPS O-acetylase OafA/YrhL